MDDLFWAKVRKTHTCWIWVGARKPTGYGNLRRDRKYLLAHRVAYEWMHGPIPDGLVIDHLCRNPSCVNPEHLEAVPQSVNVRRGDRCSVTHCPQGHEYTPANTRYGTGRYSGCRSCKTCGRESARIASRRARSKA